MAIFLRHSWNVKPPRWGSPTDVQYAIKVNAEKVFGVDPDSIVLAMPSFWGLPPMDFSGRNNHGINHGAIYTSQGLLTDGVNDYIDLGNDPSHAFGSNASNFTITVLIRRISAISAYERYIIRQYPGGDGWQLVRNGVGNTIFLVEKGGTQNRWSIGGASPKEIPTKWTTYTFCHNYSAQSAIVYENGNNVNASRGATSGFSWGSTNNLWIGGRTDGTNWSNIEVAAFMLHNCQLSADQVALFHALPYGLYQPVSRPIWLIPAAATTSPPTTLGPTTPSPTTAAPTTLAPTTSYPTTIAPTTVPVATTPSPTTSAPTTAYPTSAAPTTLAPTTLPPTTVTPTTLPPTTLAPTTLAPTTAAPTTLAPTTLTPTSLPPTSLAPTSLAPTTLPPTSLPPTTTAPTSLAPTTPSPTTLPPTTIVPTTAVPTSLPPTTLAPTTLPPTTLTPTTAQPTTLLPTTLGPTTIAPTTLPPTTLVPTTDIPEAICIKTCDSLITSEIVCYTPITEEILCYGNLC